MIITYNTSTLTIKYVHFSEILQNSISKKWRFENKNCQKFLRILNDCSEIIFKNSVTETIKS